MTALKRYERLECPGQWQEEPQARWREVAVSMRATSLILSDPQSGQVLAHWSLPAVTRLRAGTPALYAPDDGDDGETLALDDAMMIDALEQVRRVIAGRGPALAWLRPVALATVLAGLVAAAVLWLPDALVRHAATVVPTAARADIGRAMLAEMADGAPCNAEPGVQALQRLESVLDIDGARLAVIERRSGTATAHALPGGTIALDAALMREADSPALAAGHALAAHHKAAGDDPLVAVLQAAGMGATLRLLTSGEMPRPALRGASGALAASLPPPEGTRALAERFARSGVAPEPYGLAADPSGALVGRLTAATADAPPPSPDALLTPGDWAALRDICAQ